METNLYTITGGDVEDIVNIIIEKEEERQGAKLFSIAEKRLLKEYTLLATRNGKNINNSIANKMVLDMVAKIAAEGYGIENGHFDASPTLVRAVDSLKNKDKKINMLFEKLEAGVKSVFTSDKYKDYLTTMSRMPIYSYHNTLLIYMSNPDATIISTYNKMREEYGHQIKQGEKSFELLRPNKYNKSPESAIKEIDRYIETNNFSQIGRYIFTKNPDASYNVNLGIEKISVKANLPKKELRTFIKEEVIKREFANPKFVPYSVFDISQAAPVAIGKDNEGNDIIDPKAKSIRLTLADKVVDFSDLEKVKKLYEAAARTSKVPIKYQRPIGKENGYYSKEGFINITYSLSQTQALKTLIHELSHERLHNFNNEVSGALEKRQKEIEAESVAYIVCSYFGIDTSDYSFGYVAAWGGEQELKVLKSSLYVIQKESSGFIEEINIQQEKIKDIIKDAVHLHNPIFDTDERIRIEEINGNNSIRSQPSIYYVAEYRECHLAGKYEETASLEKAITIYQEFSNSSSTIGTILDGEKKDIYPDTSLTHSNSNLVKAAIKICQDRLGEVKSDITKSITDDIYPAQHVKVDIYCMKIEKKEEYALRSYERLIYTEGKKIDIENYELIASWKMEKVTDLKTLPQTIYTVANTTDILKTHAAKEAVFEEVSVSNVIVITREGQKAFSFYVDMKDFLNPSSVSFKEIPNFMVSREIIDSKISVMYKRFREIFAVNPVIAIADASKNGINELKASIMSKINRKILPCPDKENPLERYLKDGKAIAEKILEIKESIAVQVISSNSDSFKAGAIMGYKEANSKYMLCNKLADQFEAHKDEDNLKRITATFFFLEVKSEISAYQTGITFGSKQGSTLAESVRAAISFEKTTHERVLEIGKIGGLALNERERSNFKKEIASLEICAAGLREVDKIRLPHIKESNRCIE